MEPETFLRAAVQGKMHVIEKFLADGGSPDTCDEVVLPQPLAAPRTGLGLQLGRDGSIHQY